MTIKQLKKGEWFTIKDYVVPAEQQVWVKGEYDRTTKSYSCYNYADVNKERFFKADKQVFTGFTF